MFQSTHPHGVRPKRQQNNKQSKLFQSTHPHGVRHSFVVLCKDRTKSFNPRTHTGCDRNRMFIKYQYHVSIHAPTRGATLNAPLLGRFLHVSIHAPTRGATLSLGTNDTTGKRVSIHAPTRGATLYKIPVPLTYRRFNPRTHTGCDIIAARNFAKYGCFNPRTHTGCDYKEICTPIIFLVSIHAPTRGAT